MTFNEVWKTLLVPGEYDDMDDCDKSRWRGVIESAYNIGMEQQKHKDAEICYKMVLYTGLDCADAILKGDE